MAVPAKKISRARRGSRRAHQGANSAMLQDCPECHAPKLPHHVCRQCGFYDGREVLPLRVQDEDEDGQD